MMDGVASTAGEEGTFLQLGGLAELSASAVAELSAHRVLFLDPDEMVAEELRRKLPADLQGSVHTVMLGAASGVTELYQTNFPALNGVRAPAEALFSMFPGLKILHRKSVSCAALGPFLASQQPLPLPLRLKLRCPGSERDVLTALKEADLLHSVETLDIRCFSVEAFEGSADCDTLLAWLKEEGFTLRGRDDSDPDQPIFLLAPDLHALALADLQHELSTLRETIAEREKRIAALQEGIAASQTERTDLVTKLLSAQAHAAELMGELSEQAEQITSLRCEGQERYAALEAQVATLREDLGKAAERESALRAEIASGLHERDTARKAEADLAGKYEELSESAARNKAMLDEFEVARVSEGRAAEERIDELNSKLAAVEAGYKAQFEKLKKAADWRGGRIAELETETAALTKARDEMQVELETHRQESAAKQQRITELEAETAVLTKARDETQVELETHKKKADWRGGRIAELETEQASLAKERDGLRVMLRGREEDLEKLRIQQQHDSILTLRVTMLHEADLRDLRQRYAAVEAERNEAEALLQTLTVRLTEAAQYLQQFEPTVIAARGAGAGLLPATVDKPARKKSGKKKGTPSEKAAQ